MKRAILVMLLALICLGQVGCANLITLALLTWLVVERWEDIEDEDPKDWFFAVSETAEDDAAFADTPLAVPLTVQGPAHAVATAKVVDEQGVVIWSAPVHLNETGQGTRLIDGIIAEPGTYKIAVDGGPHQLPSTNTTTTVPLTVAAVPVSDG